MRNVYLCYGLILALHVASQFVIIPLPVNVVATAAAIVYIGSYASLHMSAETDTMSTKDAYMFPVIGSGVLFGLYLLFKFLNKDYVNLLLTAYFVFLGFLAVEESLRPAVAAFVSTRPLTNFALERIPTFLHEKGRVDVRLGAQHLVAGAAAAAFVTWYGATKHWVANNVLGVAFSVQGIQHVSLGNYKIGALLLAGLFVYDVFWVFGTDVMVTVAKSFDAPIKLLFVRKFATEEAKAEHSLLGLGDIVIPGIFIALLLRFDAAQSGQRVQPDKRVEAGAVKPRFFTSNLVAYCVGLGATLAAMLLFESAQPALLYLVPACLGTSFAHAVATGKLKELLAYSEEEEEEKEGEKEKASGDGREAVAAEGKKDS